MIFGRESSVSPTQGRHLYTLQAWADRFQSWSRDLAKKFEAAQDISVDILVGVQLIEAAAARTTGKDKIVLAAAAAEIRKLSAADIPSAVRKIIESGAESPDDPACGSPPRHQLWQGTGGHGRSRPGPLQRLV